MKNVHLFCVIALLSAFVVRAADKLEEVKELPKADADGWITLFNGKDLTNWQGDPNVWRVENGYISGKAEKVNGNTFLIFNHPFSNFLFECKWQIIKGNKFAGNSGIQYRSKVASAKGWVVGGYQADIGEGYTGILYEERGSRGIMVKPVPEASKSVKKDDWNTYQIAAEGAKLKQIMNGITTVDIEDKDEAKRALSGIIALQYHAPGDNFEIRFKDVRIKVLPETK